MILLGIDIGTSSVKCMLIDGDMAVIGDASASVELIAPQPLYTEQRPEDWWDAVLTALRKVEAEGNICLQDVVGVALCGQMHGLVPIDCEGNTIRPAILWNDLRTVEECREIIGRVGGVDELVQRTNNTVLPGYTIPKILWLKNHEPENYRHLARFVMPKDYIGYRLTGELYTDVSDASGTGVFDVRYKRWATGIIDSIGIDRRIFPEVRESAEIAGYVTVAAAASTGLRAGIPVFAGAGDGVCQSAGMGVVDGDVLGVVIGTSGVVSAVQKTFSINTGGRLQYFCNCVPGEWITIGCQLSSGASIQWANQKILRGPQDFSLFNNLAAQARAGSGGVIYLPYIGGERCPYNDANARGVYFGFTAELGLPEIARATMEGVTFGLYQIYRLTTSCNPSFSPRYCVTSGGAVKSPLWRQILADIFNLPVKTLKGATGGGAFGAAVIAGIGLGIWGSMREALSHAAVGAYTEPSNDNMIYRELFKVYDSLYGNLQDSFAALSALTI
jgi:xylulokinase